MDGGACASYLLENFAAGEVGQTCSADFECDISGFAESTYKVRYILYSRDELGRDYLFDYVEGLCFEKVITESTKKGSWNHKNWGYVRMEEPQVTNLRLHV